MNFESGFSDTERAATAASKSAATLVGALKQLQKAAALGELGAMGRAAEKITLVLKSVCQEVDNAVTAWPFAPESEERYLRDSYAEELLERARAEGMQVLKLDDGLLMYPSFIRINPSERAVVIDRTRLKAIRPSQLLKKLKAIQSSKPKIGPDQFLELLYRTYRLLADKQHGKTVGLASIYEALTLMPGSTASYGQSEFARDLFLLDRSGVTKTKSGAKVSLPASTGTKGGRSTLSFVSPDGETVSYYGIHFQEGLE